MKDLRASSKISRHVKEELAAAKKELRLPTESHVIDYLFRFYQAKRGTISLVDHERLLKEVEEAHNQLSI